MPGKIHTSSTVRHTAPKASRKDTGAALIGKKLNVGGALKAGAAKSKGAIATAAHTLATHTTASGGHHHHITA